MSDGERDSWVLEGAAPDKQTTDADWAFVGRQLIEGVIVREVRNVPKGNGMITELFRRDWFDADVQIDQVFQAILEAHCVSAWHAHAQTVDRLFVNRGTVRIVLYDARPASTTRGLVNELVLGLHRPALVVVPPRVWHGAQNLLNTPSAIVNIPDRAYQYDSPDHWRLPADTDQIPYRFTLAMPLNGGRERDGI